MRTNRARIAWLLVVAALAPTAGGIGDASAADIDPWPAPVAISRVRLEHGCGPTPTPGEPPPSCPSVSEVEFVFRGERCDADDFEVRVRQKKWSQIVLVYRLASSDCTIDRFSWDGGEFTRIELTTYQIDPRKRIRFKNSVPIFDEPRP